MFKLNLEISGTGRNSVSEISLENDVFSLGSGPANGPGFVILPSLGGIVSRVHATLFKDGKSWFIRDGNGKPSKNGVWLNFHGWVTEPVRLEPGQVFVLAENSTGAIRLKTQPIETTKPGISPYGDSESPPTAVSPSGGKKMVSAVQVDLEKTELLPPVTLSVVLSRIDKIERYLVKSQNHLNAQSIKGHKGAALICAFLAGLLLTVSAGTILEPGEQRGQFKESFLEAVGGPVGLGTGLGAVVSMALSMWVNPSKEDDDVLN